MACRTARPKRDLVRVVRAPDGTLSLDAGGRAPGRGAYLCRDAACWDAAGRKRAIEHALGSPLPPALAAALAAGPDATGSPTLAGGPMPAPEHKTTPGGEAHGQE